MPFHRVLETIAPAPDIFDVVIVDEASQCGPESVALLYLAKKVVIVGDDQQISPQAVGIDRDDVFAILDHHLTGFKFSASFNVDGSLFAQGGIRYGDRLVLREHFRCVPEIIQFSNQLCYPHQPLVPLRQYPPDRLRPVVTVRVPDGFADGTADVIVNPREAACVVEAVAACCRDPRHDGKRMGVISLQGEAQAKRIEAMLVEHLGAEEIEKRQLICGDAYSFQGDERHVMFLSLVAAPNRRIGALTQPADKRRFNVAASRAQDRMSVFHTATLNDLSPSCLRYQLLQYCQAPGTVEPSALDVGLEELRSSASLPYRSRGPRPRPFESWFEVDVFVRIAERGYRVVPQYRVGNYRIDLVVEGSQSRIAVECDGDDVHDLEHFEQDMARQRTLERCGWRFWRVRGSAFYVNPAEALAGLWGVCQDGKQCRSLLSERRCWSRQDPSPAHATHVVLESCISRPTGDLSWHVGVPTAGSSWSEVQSTRPSRSWAFPVHRGAVLAP